MPIELRWNVFNYQIRVDYILVMCICLGGLVHYILFISALEQQIMSQIIPIFIGGFGTETGKKFIKSLRSEQVGQDNNFKGKQTMVYEHGDQKFDDRSLFIDTDFQLYNSLSKTTVSASSMVTDSYSCMNLFPQGYKMNIDYKYSVNEAIRHKVQQCDSLSGFILTNSVIGGAGSGVGSSIVQVLADQYPKTMRDCNLLIPDWKGNITPISIYNTLLSSYHFIENADSITLFQSQAYFKRYQRDKEHKYDLPNYAATNLMEMTAGFRFGGHLNTNQRKKNSNLIPYPRLKFLIPSMSSPDEKYYLESAFEPRHRTVVRPLRGGYAFGFWINVRGDPSMCQSECYKIIKKQTRVWKFKFIDFFPNWLHLSSINETNLSKGPSAVAISNSPQNFRSYTQIKDLFSKIFRKKMFTHHYLDRGIQMPQFYEAQSNLNDLADEYIPYRGCECEPEAVEDCSDDDEQEQQDY